MNRPKKNPVSEFWGLDEETIFLNHGSYGATPKIVLEEQKRWQKLVERDPVKFYEEIAPEALLEARKAIAKFVKCDYDDLALIENATSGVNTVLRSLNFNNNDGYIFPVLVTYCTHNHYLCRKYLIKQNRPPI